MANTNELLLIDGSSFLYRAYFAVKKSLTTKDGFPTGAIYIITNMLQILLDQFEGSKMVLVFDAKGGSFRNQLYPQYKATRPPMPEDLQKQIEMVHKIAKAMGFPLVMVPGVEADDVLGSYTKAAQALGMHVVICTGDKDLAQLVNPNVTLYDTMKNTRYDEETVLDKYGVKPEHMVDLLALKGDSADNIPGMSGVGEKTATTLVQSFGGIYDIKAHVDDIKNIKMRGAATFGEKFLAQWPQIELSYRLATIKCDVPLPIAIEDLQLPKTDYDTLIAIFERLEFFRLAAKQRTKKVNFTQLVDSMRAKDVSKGTKAAGDAESSARDSSSDDEALLQSMPLGAGAKDSNKEKKISSSGAVVSDQELVSAAILRPQTKRKFEPSYAERLAQYLQNQQLFQQQEEAEAQAGAEAKIDVEAGAEAEAGAGAVVASEGGTISPRRSLQFQEIFAYRDSYELVNTDEQLQQMVQTLKQSGRFSIYLEESSHHVVDSLLLGLACCCRVAGSTDEQSGASYKAYYIPLRHNYLSVPEQLSQSKVLHALSPLLQDPELKKIIYDLKQVRLYLHFLGIDVQGYVPDSMLIAHIINSSRDISLDSLSHDFLKYLTLDVKNLVPDHAFETTGIDVDIFKDFACERAQVAYRLYDCCLEELRTLANGEELLAHEMKVLEVLYGMEECGALVDGKQLQALTKHMQAELFLVQENIYDLAGEQFNIASTKRLGQVLFEKMMIPYPKKKARVDRRGKRIYSTDDQTLNDIGQYPIAERIQRYRMLSKLISTYADKLPTLISKRTGRVHTYFNLAGTVTGRLSSSEPNLQNIPARTNEGLEIRKTFVAPAGYKVVSADYSQIELRLIAHFSEDENLITAFNNHQDIHRATAAEVLGKPLDAVTDKERKHAKATNFGLMYGMGPQGLSRQTGMSIAEAKDYVERYFAKYPRVKSLMDKIIEEARTNGYVQTLLHNRVFINNIQSQGVSMRAAERSAINAPMQGSAADIIKKAMVEVAEYIKTLPEDSVHMTLQVHDELVFEVREDVLEEFCAHIKELLEHVVTLKVPLEVGIGVADTWADAH